MAKVRYIIAFISFLGFILNHSIKNVTNVTLVAMADEFESKIANMPGNQTQSFSPSNTTSEQVHLDKVTQNKIQLSFFFGYLILQVPSGRISEIIGTRRMFGPAILIACCLSFLIPASVRLGIAYVQAIRFLQGLCLGVSFPTMHGLLARWAPITERSLLIAFTFSGAPFGIVIVEILSGILSESSFLGGWPSIYYIIGVTGCVWSALWFFFVYDSPEVHPMIEEDEMKEINKGRNRQIGAKVRARMLLCEANSFSSPETISADSENDHHDSGLRSDSEPHDLRVVRLHCRLGTAELHERHFPALHAWGRLLGKLVKVWISPSWAFFLSHKHNNKHSLRGYLTLISDISFLSTGWIYWFIYDVSWLSPLISQVTCSSVEIRHLMTCNRNTHLIFTATIEWAGLSTASSRSYDIFVALRAPVRQAASYESLLDYSSEKSIQLNRWDSQFFSNKLSSTFLGSFGPALCFAIIPFFGDNRLVTELLFVVSMGLAGSCVPGKWYSRGVRP